MADDLEFIKAIKALSDASEKLNLGAEKMNDGSKLADKVFDKFGLGRAREFQKAVKESREKRKAIKEEKNLRRQQEKEVRQRLGGKDPISKAQFKQLKKEAELTKKKEAVDAAFKSFVETNLGLNEQLLKEIQQRQEGKLDKSGDRVTIKGRRGRFSTPERFLEKFTEESALARATAGKNQMGFSLGDAGSPGDKNRAAEEERTRDQQSFEMEKTESTNDILRDILAALTGSGIEKKEEGVGIGGGLFAGLMGAKGLGALKKAIGGVATALGAATLAGGKGAAKAGKGLLGKLGGLARIVGPGLPLLLGLSAAAGAFILLKDRSEEFRKKVEEDTARIREDIKNAKTTAEVAEAGAGTPAQAVNQEAERIARLAGGQTESQAQESRVKGEVLVDRFKEKQVIQSSQDFNEIIRNSTAFFNATRDAAIGQGNTLKERYDFFDRQVGEVLMKVESSAAFLKADKAGQQAMIGQVIAAANKSITGAGRKSQFLRGLSPEDMKNQAAIEGRRTRTFTALQYGATGDRMQDALSHMSDIMGGGRNMYSMKRVAELEARVAQAQKDADEETWYERNIGSNQGDIDKLNNLTKVLERLRDTLAATDRSSIPPIIAPNNSTTSVTQSSASVTHPIHMTDQNTSSEVLYP